MTNPFLLADEDMPNGTPTKSIEAVDNLLDVYARRMARSKDPLQRRNIRKEVTSQILQLVNEARIEELKKVIGYNADIDNYGWEKYAKSRLKALEDKD